MATTNPVYQVLVTSGNQNAIAAGSTIDDLLHGQIGFFNYHTNLSIDGSAPADAKDIFIVVGINRVDSGGNATDIQRSAGQVIQTKNARALTFQGVQDAIQKVVEISNINTLADTSYGIKIEYRNQKSYLLNGYNGYTKTYDALTEPSTDPLSLTGDNIELVKKLVAAINRDPDKLVVATAFATIISAEVTADATADGTLVVTIGDEEYDVPVLNGDTAAQVAAKISAAIKANEDSLYDSRVDADSLLVSPKKAYNTGGSLETIVLTDADGSGVTFAASATTYPNVDDLDAFDGAYGNAGVGIRITGVAQAVQGSNNDINVKYNKAGTDFIVSLPYGFIGTEKVETITELQFAAGSGADLKMAEYEAGGWNGKPGPYRQSSVTGLAREGFDYNVSPSVNYHQFVLAYDQESVGGWLEYKNNLETIIAVPEDDTTTASSIATVLSAIFTQFGSIVNDVAANDTEKLSTHKLLPATDGVESLS